MKKLITLFAGLIPLLSFAQINFVQGLTWNQVLDKAKLENKVIFVDAYTTWCIPCKDMDINVFTNLDVGVAANENYISVKVQMDKTDGDSEKIKAWYQKANDLAKYITAYPSFLFFSAEGKFIGKEVGYQSPANFLAILKKYQALRNDDLLIRFKRNELNETELYDFAFRLKELKDDSSAIQVAEYYKGHFIDKTESVNVLNNSFAKFISSFGRLFRPQDQIFKFMLNHPKYSDSLMSVWEGFSQSTTDFIIREFELSPLLWTDDNAITEKPDWKRIEQRLRTRFGGSNAKRNLLWAKIRFYHKLGDWDRQIKYEIEQKALNGLDTSPLGANGINTLVYELFFLHAKDLASLQKGIEYMEIILKKYPENFHYSDTYANILYKAGYKERALKAAKRTLELAKKDKGLDTETMTWYQDVLKKITNNEPTWIQAYTN
ncbi:thioredoxin fold domain-containing protein [Pedobacter sp. JY14-1]|uniref:thioredoxin fold domain-containing protein n=1 Tax=Pedobacter sp. JY14-1 TaxID=3034151 RepID=UPI0023E26345|nr:thioredoxin fold domain-containing protein [Pedobacter sp. JY14-1]